MRSSGTKAMPAAWSSVAHRQRGQGASLRAYRPEWTENSLARSATAPRLSGCCARPTLLRNRVYRSPEVEVRVAPGQTVQSLVKPPGAADRSHAVVHPGGTHLEYRVSVGARAGVGERGGCAADRRDCPWTHEGLGRAVRG
jgi:hypothetical protein